MQSNRTDVYVANPMRTPHGRFGGSLREASVLDIGTAVASRVLESSGVNVDAIGELILSHCRQAGNGANPGRPLALRAGLPETTPAQTVNMACASGLKILDLARQSIMTGASEAVLAVAAESMSTMPYLASSSLRWKGQGAGDIVLMDGWRDAAVDPICGCSVGETAENIAAKYGISREAQDAWALRSHERVARAWDEGRFEREVMPLNLQEASLDQDETFRRDTSAEKLARLRTVFREDGTVTAGNSSQMTDGAAAAIVAGADAVQRMGLRPLGRLVAFASVGVDPAHMGLGPTQAIPRVLDRAGMTTKDIDLWEINEAFAAQIIQNVEELGLDPDIVNVNGGGIALGHPTGQSGLRIVVTLLHEMERQNVEVGVASLCVGGGQGIAAVIERVAA